MEKRLPAICKAVGGSYGRVEAGRSGCQGCASPQGGVFGQTEMS